MARSLGVVQNSGVDYITVTSDVPRNAEVLRVLGSGLLNQERTAGNDISSFWLATYSGLACGSVQVAQHGPSLMLRLSGHLAARHWQEAAECATNVSRFDLQTTIVVDPKTTLFAERLEYRALAHVKKHDSRLTVELKRNNRTGNTLYLGRRKSDRLIRIYDKGRESKLPELENHWRAESEYHRKLAFSRAKRLLEHADPDALASFYVCEDLQKLGISWPRLRTVPRLVPQALTPRYVSNSSKRLQWLACQVAGTVARELELGHRQEVMKALGLDLPEKED